MDLSQPLRPTVHGVGETQGPKPELGCTFDLSDWCQCHVTGWEWGVMTGVLSMVIQPALLLTGTSGVCWG